MMTADAKENKIVKVASYDVNTSSRHFNASNKKEALSVAAAWRKNGESPEVFAIGDAADGTVATHRIA